MFPVFFREPCVRIVTDLTVDAPDQTPRCRISENVAVVRGAVFTYGGSHYIFVLLLRSVRFVSLGTPCHSLADPFSICCLERVRLSLLNFVRCHFLLQVKLEPQPLFGTISM